MKTELATYVNMAKKASQLGNKGSEKNWRWREKPRKEISRHFKFKMRFSKR